MTGASTVEVEGLQIRVARSFGARLVGLLGRRTLPREQGLLLIPCNNVHTFFMRFVIDVVFIDRDGVVLAVVPRLAPWRVAATRRAHACLEMAAGVAAALGLESGMRIAQLADPRRAR